jgi:hypothetical protein
VLFAFVYNDGPVMSIMRMDPVIVLVEDLRVARSSLRAAAGQRRHDDVRRLLLDIRCLENRLAETAPTSALGAGELLRIAAERLWDARAHFANHLSEIADRLSEGRRALDDMIWLRTTARALESEPGGKRSLNAAVLVRAAVAGAARPVLVFRSAKTSYDLHDVEFRVS